MYVVTNEVTGRIAGPAPSFDLADKFCWEVLEKGRHVAPVVFMDTTSQAARRVLRMGKTIWNNGSHRKGN